MTKVPALLSLPPGLTYSRRFPLTLDLTQLLDAKFTWWEYVLVLIFLNAGVDDAGPVSAASSLGIDGIFVVLIVF